MIRHSVSAVDCSDTEEVSSCPGDGLGLVQLEAVAPYDPGLGESDKSIVNKKNIYRIFISMT